MCGCDQAPTCSSVFTVPLTASMRARISPMREPTLFTRRFTASLIEDQKPAKRTCGRRDGEPRQSSLAPLITQEW